MTYEEQLKKTAEAFADFMQSQYELQEQLMKTLESSKKVQRHAIRLTKKYGN